MRVATEFLFLYLSWIRIGDKVKLMHLPYCFLSAVPSPFQNSWMDLILDIARISVGTTSLLSPCSLQWPFLATLLIFSSNTRSSQLKKKILNLLTIPSNGTKKRTQKQQFLQYSLENDTWVIHVGHQNIGFLFNWQVTLFRKWREINGVVKS